MKNTHTHNSTVAMRSGSCNPKDGNPIAALTKQNKNTGVAVLAFSVGEIDKESNRVQLLPDGKFQSKDGRPADVKSGNWLLDEQSWAMLKADAAQRENDFHFDYEHQTLYSDENGQPAIAAGWFNTAALEYIPGKGLFANNVNWTPKAAKHIRDKEYRLASAVFAYDKNGRPTQFLHAALTNDPAVDGMKAIAALKHQFTPNSTNQSGDKTMDEFLEAFLRLLGLLGVAEEDEDLSDPDTLKAAEERAKKAIEDLQANAEKAEADLKKSSTENVALKAKQTKQSKDVDLSKFVPKETYDATVTQLAALKTEQQTDSVEQLLKDNADKVFEAETQYLTDFGEQQGVAALKTMLSKRPAITALKTTQTNGKKKPESKDDGELDDVQIAVCKQMGVTQKQFKKQLATQGED